MLKSLRDYTLRAPTILDSDGPGAANVNGTPGNDSLTGTDRSDVLNGGAGDDTMAGGLGNDQYFVDSVGDVVIEDAGQGYDTVTTSISFVLGANFEYLDLFGSANINGTGNAASNVIDGNSGNNILDGGAGADGMYGQAGDDTFMVDNVLDQAQESEDQGNDTVIASVSYTLYIASFVENLILSGGAHLNGTGNGLGNVITGNTGNNTLSGLDGNDSLDGGAGDDTLYGGLGDDSFFVDNAADRVNEDVNAGIDTVYASVSYTLGDNVENLTLIGFGPMSATGNGLDNVITGPGGSAILNGGLGDDTLIGGDGLNTLYGGLGADRLEAGNGGGDLWNGDNQVAGLAVEDFAVDTLIGGKGADVLYVGLGDIADGGSQPVNRVDRVFVSFFGLGSALDLDLSTGDAYATLAAVSGGSYAHFEEIGVFGTVFADHVSGTQGNDRLFDLAPFDGNGGDDTYYGMGGDDRISGGSGANYVDGGDGNDILYDTSFETETFVGGAGDDLLVYGSTAPVDIIGEGADSFDGGDGSDLLYYTKLTANLTVDLGVTTQQDTGVNLLTLSGVENIQGGSGNDRFIGDGGVNWLAGDSGNDWLDGGSGMDTLIGGVGDDTFVVDDAGDVVNEFSEQGSDLVYVSINYKMGADVEGLIQTGNGDIDATGNGLANALLGNSGNNRLDGGLGDDTLSGGAGDDTYQVDSVGDVVIEAPGGGNDIVYASVSYTLGDNVEYLELADDAGNIDGTGNADDNRIYGNAGDNVLTGGGGDDVLYGEGNYFGSNYTTSHAGADSLYGGDGNDGLLGGGSAGSIATLNGDAGNDIIHAGAYSRADGGTGIDALYLDMSDYGADTGMGVSIDVSAVPGGATVNLASGGSIAGFEAFDITGTAYDDTLIDASNGYGKLRGGDGNDRLEGRGGNDWLDGGAGADTLLGGLGDDTFRVDNSADVVIELNGQGRDEVIATASYSLATAYVEVLTLTGYDNIDGKGNGLNNLITGNGGNNRLDGAGGADTLQGWTGDDTYVIDNAGDVVIEDGGNGTDTVLTPFTTYIQQAIENLILTGTGNVNAYGSGGAEHLTGNSGDNLLNGFGGNDVLTGGAGLDTLVGGLGDDTLVVDTVGDVVTELNGQGTDVILSSVSFALSNSLYVETLTLTGPQHINATGNAYANVLNGNSGNNTLNGGSGADTMAGGTGHDIYVVENLGDVVIEGVNAGTDTVQSAVSFVLGDNVENLTLAGSAAINGTGNGLANIIYGNNGANLLIGGGGADKIYGRGGNDTYVVDNTGMGISELLGGVDAGGIDQVLASVSYSLKDYFENLTLTGVANINGVGNGLANSLVGNNGNNNLNGGAGNDTLTGGLGADIFVFGTAAGVDRVTDFSAAQNDRINVHLVAQGVVGGGGISLSQVGGDTVIDLGGGNMVTVVGAVLADVQSHMVW